jgi:hypothetical protein
MWWFAASLRKGGYEGPNLHLLHSTMSRSSTYKQNSLPRSWHTSVLRDDGGSRLPYLHVCRILIKMADAFFSSSWRIREPFGCSGLFAAFGGPAPIALRRRRSLAIDLDQLGARWQRRQRAVRRPWCRREPA